MKKVFNVDEKRFEFTEGTAIWHREPKAGRRQALLVHMLSDTFRDGDFVVFDASFPLDDDDAETIVLDYPFETYYRTLNTFLPFATSVPIKGKIEIKGTSLIVDGKEYLFHHTALKAGYVNKKWDLKICAEHAQKYHGRFGDGYTVLTPNFNTTRYCDCTYYIAKKEDK